MDITTVTRSYLTTALWSSVDENGEPMDDAHDLEDFSPEAWERAEEVVSAFVESAGADLEGIDPGQVGHDLWLTQNHHGAGFWDRGLGERGERLTALAHPFGECYVIVADSGSLELEG